MSIFDFLTVALSLVLGLGLTRLLESAVEAFRVRKTVQLHWLPFAWALAVLIQQLQFWWAMYELQQMASVNVSTFVLLLLLAMLLFVAGALVLPTGEAGYPDDLLDYFSSDGAWGVAAVGAYHLIAIFANLVLFNVPLHAPIIWLGVLCGALAMVVAFASTSRVRLIASLAWFVLLALVLVIATLPAYTDTSMA